MLWVLLCLDLFLLLNFFIATSCIYYVFSFFIKVITIKRIIIYIIILNVIYFLTIFFIYLLPITNRFYINDFKRLVFNPTQTAERSFYIFFLICFLILNYGKYKDFWVNHIADLETTPLFLSYFLILPLLVWYICTFYIIFLIPKFLCKFLHIQYLKDYLENPKNEIKHIRYYTTYSSIATLAFLSQFGSLFFT